MSGWIELATKVGVPIAGFAILAWAVGKFLYKTLWPWMTSQIEKTQAARERDLDRFATQIGKITEEQTKAIRELSDEIRTRRRN